MIPQVRPSLEWILECVVILSWTDLLGGHRPGSIHIEYAFSPEGSISTLKLWLSTVRGHWRLMCGLGTELDSRIRFEDCCKSDDLVSNLEFTLRHQTAFLPLASYGRAGLLQINSPTRDEIERATVAVKAARSFVDSISKQPANA